MLQEQGFIAVFDFGVYPRMRHVEKAVTGGVAGNGNNDSKREEDFIKAGKIQ